jgi:hypothetical protein
MIAGGDRRRAAVTDRAASSDKGTTDGALAWARATHGVLGRHERSALARQAVGAQLRAMPGTVRALLGGGGRAARAWDPDLLPPDTALAANAFALAASACSPALLGHCLRTWLWGTLFAELDGVPYDDEVFYLAALLHDLDLGADTPGEGCFAVTGAWRAGEALRAGDAPPRLGDEVTVAIILHLDLAVPPRIGPEAYLLQAGSHLDVAGTRAVDLPRETRRAVVARHPRDGVAAEMARRFAVEAERNPHSRAAVLWRCGLRLPIALNPVR